MITLKLKKYIEVISSMTYEQMMETTESELISRGVTQGAAGRILREIEKLKNRSKRINEIIQVTFLNFIK